MLEMIVADTSYSDAAAPDKRGAAVAEVVVTDYEPWDADWGFTHADATHAQDTHAQARSVDVSKRTISSAAVHGVLADGRRYAYHLPPLQAQPPPPGAPHGIDALHAGEEADTLVGQRCGGPMQGYVVTARLADETHGRVYRVSRARDRAVETRDVSVDDLLPHCAPACCLVGGVAEAQVTAVR